MFDEWRRPWLAASDSNQKVGVKIARFHRKPSHHAILTVFCNRRKTDKVIIDQVAELFDSNLRRCQYIRFSARRAFTGENQIKSLIVINRCKCIVGHFHNDRVTHQGLVSHRSNSKGKSKIGSNGCVQRTRTREQTNVNFNRIVVDFLKHGADASVSHEFEKQRRPFTTHERKAKEIHPDRSVGCSGRNHEIGNGGIGPTEINCLCTNCVVRNLTASPSKKQGKKKKEQHFFSALYSNAHRLQT